MKNQRKKSLHQQADAQIRHHKPESGSMRHPLRRQDKSDLCYLAYITVCNKSMIFTKTQDEFPRASETSGLTKEPLGTNMNFNATYIPELAAWTQL
jgi:hypothetical protein